MGQAPAEEDGARILERVASQLASITGMEIEVCRLVGSTQALRTLVAIGGPRDECGRGRRRACHALRRERTRSALRAGRPDAFLCPRGFTSFVLPVVAAAGRKPDHVLLVTGHTAPASVSGTPGRRLTGVSVRHQLALLMSIAELVLSWVRGTAAGERIFRQAVVDQVVALWRAHFPAYGLPDKDYCQLAYDWFVHAAAELTGAPIVYLQVDSGGVRRTLSHVGLGRDALRDLSRRGWRHGITGLAFRTGTSQLVNNGLDSNTIYFCCGAQAGSELVVPVFDMDPGAKCRGVLNAEHPDEDHFAPEHQLGLELLSRVLTPVLASDDSIRTPRHQWLAGFAGNAVHAYELIAKEQSMRAMLGHLAAAAAHLFSDYPELDVAASVWIDDRHCYELVLAAAHNEGAQHWGNHTLGYHASDGLRPARPKSYAAIESPPGQKQWVDIFRPSPPRDEGYCQSEGFVSLLATPILNPRDPKARPMGVLNVFTRRPFDFRRAPHVKKAIQALAYQAGLSLWAANERSRYEAVAGLREIALRSATREGFLQEAVGFMANQLRSAACSIFMPRPEPDRCILVATTDSHLQRMLGDPNMIEELTYGSNQGLTGGIIRLGPPYVVRIRQLDDREGVERMQAIMRQEAQKPDLTLEFKNRVREHVHESSADTTNRQYMAGCFVVPRGGRGADRHGLVRFWRPARGQEWDRYMMCDTWVLRGMCEVLTESLQHYGVADQITGDLAHTFRQFPVALRTVPVGGQELDEADLARASRDDLASALRSVRQVVKGAELLNRVLTPPTPRWEQAGGAPWVIRLRDVVDCLATGKARIIYRDRELGDVSPTIVLTDLDRAHYLALVLNELVTNAARHGSAGPGEEEVLITVRATHADGRLTMSVANRAPRGALGSMKDSSRGLRLIDCFVRDILRGKRQVAYAEGQVTQTVTVDLTVEEAPHDSV